MKNAEDVKKINEENKRLKQIQHERELEEEAKIEQYKKNQGNYHFIQK